jgi:hypothetical protein
MRFEKFDEKEKTSGEFAAVIEPLYCRCCAARVSRAARLGRRRQGENQIQIVFACITIDPINGLIEFHQKFYHLRLVNSILRTEGSHASKQTKGLSFSTVC